MNLPYYIAKRLSSQDEDAFSKIILRIAVASIALGLAVMIVSFLILKGFQFKIREKMISFGGHLQVTKFNMSHSFDEEPISRNNELMNNYSQYPFIIHIQEYASKAGLIKSNEEVMGIVIKGVTPSFDLERFEQNMIEGRFLEFNDSTDSREIVISRQISTKLMLKPGDEALVYFMQNPVRVRRLSIAGIYETGMEDFDERMVLGDLKLVQRINNWPDSLIGGMEVFVNDYRRIAEYQKKLYSVADYDHFIERIDEKFIEIFDWLSLLNRNVVIFLTLTLFVACFNMVSILIIMIMERTHMIGILKSIGANNATIRRIFVFNGMQLIARGLLYGNIIGIGFGLVQEHLRPLKLAPENYYMDYVPIEWNWDVILLLNLLTFFIVSLVLILPTMMISRISPIRSIRFD